MRNGSLDNQVVTVYTLERQLNDYSWTTFQPANKAQAGKYIQEGKDGEPDIVIDLEREFSASGDCWQKYGIFGTFREELATACAINCMVHLRKTVRVVKRTYDVKAQVLFTLNFTASN